MAQSSKLCMALLSMTALVLGETHEMVERMYMSRKTGTDLLPEATGFIFRKDNDGPASYVELGARVVNKHLDKYPSEYYTYPVMPEVFARPPIPLAHEKRFKVYQEQAHIPEKIIVASVQEESSDSNEDNEEYHGMLYDDSTNVDDDYQRKFDGYRSSRLSDLDNFNGYRNDNGFDDHGLSDFEGHASERGFRPDEDYNSHSLGGHGGSNDNIAYDGGKYTYGVHHGDGDEFTYGGGNPHYGDRYSRFAENISKGYKGRHGFENGEDGQHDVENHEEHYTEEADEKGASQDGNNEYGQQYSPGREYKSETTRDNEGRSNEEETTFKEGFNKAGQKYTTESGHERKNGADNHKSDFSNKASSPRVHEHANDGKV